MALITASLFMRLCLCASTILLVGANSHHHQQQQEAVIDAAQGTVVHINNNDNNDNSQGTSNNKNNEEYGVDASWPMHHHSITITPADLDHHRPNNNPLGAEARQSAYQEYLQGCLIGNAEEEEETEKSSASPASASCRRFEADRIAMNLQQPAISQNYTHAGFAKVETPPAVLQLLQEIWEEENEDASSSSSSKVLERWERGNTYLNHWHSPTYMIDITQILSTAEQRQLVQAVQSVLEAWTQQPLVLTSLYGIRIYGNEAVLSSHVDRLPLVSSAIINVAQDVEEPWPLEVIGHDGKAHNVTMEPGDMVLYESHSVIHGRPFPLQGKYYANVFVHFEPLGHSFRHIQNSPHHQETAQATYERALAYHQQQQQQQQQSQTKKVVMMNNQQHSSPRMQQKAQYDEAVLNDHGAAPTAALPYYVPPDKEVRWRQQFEYEKEPEISPKPTRATLGSINPHFAAADGALDLLKEIAAKDRSQLFKSDPNGWRPLHEAARGGHAHVVAYLLHEGAQVNERANHGEGGSPLWWAERNAKKNSKTIKVLKQHGGVSLAPLPAEARKNSAGTGTDTSNQKKAK